MSQNSKTAKMVLGRYYRVLNSRLALTRLAILNTWNKNTKTEVASRTNVVTVYPKTADRLTPSCLYNGTLPADYHQPVSVISVTCGC